MSREELASVLLAGWHQKKGGADTEVGVSAGS